MRLILVVALFGVASMALGSDPEDIPDEVASAPIAKSAHKGPWSWEVIDGKKFKVYTYDAHIPHGFSKKVYIKKTRDHIIKYIRLKKCGCHVKTTRKTWVGKHKKLWYETRKHPKNVRKHHKKHRHEHGCGCGGGHHNHHDHHDHY